MPYIQFGIPTEGNLGHLNIGAQGYTFADPYLAPDDDQAPRRATPAAQEYRAFSGPGGAFGLVQNPGNVAQSLAPSSAQGETFDPPFELLNNGNVHDQNPYLADRLNSPAQNPSVLRRMGERPQTRMPPQVSMLQGNPSPSAGSPSPASADFNSPVLRRQSTVERPERPRMAEQPQARMSPPGSVLRNTGPVGTPPLGALPLQNSTLLRQESPVLAPYRRPVDQAAPLAPRPQGLGLDVTYFYIKEDGSFGYGDFRCHSISKEEKSRFPGIDFDCDGRRGYRPSDRRWRMRLEYVLRDGELVPLQDPTKLSHAGQSHANPDAASSGPASQHSHSALRRYARLSAPQTSPRTSVRAQHARIEIDAADDTTEQINQRLPESRQRTQRGPIYAATHLAAYNTQPRRNTQTNAASTPSAETLPPNSGSGKRSGKRSRTDTNSDAEVEQEAKKQRREKQDSLYYCSSQPNHTDRPTAKCHSLLQRLRQHSCPHPLRPWRRL
jgi:hypothetical protein